jgi:hypothetical protein
MDSSVSVVIRLHMNDRGIAVVLGRRKREREKEHGVQACCGAQPASYAMNRSDVFPAGKSAGA